MTDDDIPDRSDEGKSGHDPMTDDQRINLDTLSDQMGEPTPGEHLTRAEAAEKIAELREEAGYDTTTDDQDEP